jgi:hypothetical protein
MEVDLSVGFSNGTTSLCVRFSQASHNGTSEISGFKSGKALRPLQV